MARWPPPKQQQSAAAAAAAPAAAAAAVGDSKEDGHSPTPPQPLPSSHSSSCWGMDGIPSLSYLMVPMPPVSGSNTKSLQPGRGASRQRELHMANHSMEGLQLLSQRASFAACRGCSSTTAWQQLAEWFTPPSPDPAQLLAVLRDNFGANLQDKGSTMTGRGQGGELLQQRCHRTGMHRHANPSLPSTTTAAQPAVHTPGGSIQPSRRQLGPAARPRCAPGSHR